MSVVIVALAGAVGLIFVVLLATRGQRRAGRADLSSSYYAMSSDGDASCDSGSADGGGCDGGGGGGGGGD